MGVAHSRYHLDGGVHAGTLALGSAIGLISKYIVQLQFGVSEAI